MDSFVVKEHIAGELKHNKKLLFKLFASGLCSSVGLVELGINIELAFVAFVFVPMAGLFFTYLKLEADYNVVRWLGLIVGAVVFGLLVESFFLAIACLLVLEGATHQESVVRYKDVKWLKGAQKEEDKDQLYKLLSSHTLFRALPEHLYKIMEDHCLVMELDTDAVLIKEGEFSHYLYLLGRGTVNVIHNGEHVASLNPGDIVGEISTIGLSLPIADVIAATGVLAFAFPIDAVNEVADQCSEFADTLISVGMRRMEVK